MTYDIMVTLFVAACIAIWLYRPIHTGTFGSLGLVVMSIAAAFSMDDSIYVSMASMQWCMITFMGGAGLVMLHGLLMVRRIMRTKPLLAQSTPLRRSTDFGNLDGEDSSHGVHA